MAVAGWLSRLCAGAVVTVLSTVRRSPLTMAAVTLLWGVGLLTGAVIHGPSSPLVTRVGVGVGSLAAGRLWSPLTAGLWCAGLAGYLLTTVLLVALLRPA